MAQVLLVTNPENVAVVETRLKFLLKKKKIPAREKDYALNCSRNLGIIKCDMMCSIVEFLTIPNIQLKSNLITNILS